MCVISRVIHVFCIYVGCCFLACTHTTKVGQEVVGFEIKR